MNTARIPINYTDFDSSILLKGISICVSPLGKLLAQTVCDFLMAYVYEACQAILDRLYVCGSTSINSYIKNRNLVDGQTDKLAWISILLRNELTANP
jgi:hypothetical protein